MCTTKKILLPIGYITYCRCAPPRRSCFLLVLYYLYSRCAPPRRSCFLLVLYYLYSRCAPPRRSCFLLVLRLSSVCSPAGSPGWPRGMCSTLKPLQIFLLQILWPWKSYPSALDGHIAFVPLGVWLIDFCHSMKYFFACPLICSRISEAKSKSPWLGNKVARVAHGKCVGVDSGLEMRW